MLASLFHEYGFQVVPLEETFCISILQGPVRTPSTTRPRQPTRAGDHTKLHQETSGRRTARPWDLVRVSTPLFVSCVDCRPPLIHIITSSGNAEQQDEPMGRKNEMECATNRSWDLCGFQRSRKTCVSRHNRRPSILCKRYV